MLLLVCWENWFCKSLRMLKVKWVQNLFTTNNCGWELWYSCKTDYQYSFQELYWKEAVTLMSLTSNERYHKVIKKGWGMRCMWLEEWLGLMGTYPFARAGIDVIIMLIKIFGLEVIKSWAMAIAIFLKFLSKSKFAFDLLHHIIFKLMEHKLLSIHSSHVDFNTLMKSTNRLIGRKFLLKEVSCLKDSPSYSLPTR